MSHSTLRSRAVLMMVISTLLLRVFSAVPVTAQEDQRKGPIYIVNEGDILSNIAVRFGVNLDELQAFNQLTDPNQLSVGMELFIPGLKGYAGEVDTREVAFGETLKSLSRRYQVPVDVLTGLNQLTSPAELFVGKYLVLPADRLKLAEHPRALLSKGQSLLEFAIVNNTNPWSVVEASQLPGSWGALPGDVLQLPGEVPEGPGALPEIIQKIRLSPLPVIQGTTLTLRVTAEPGIELSGSLDGREIRFFPIKNGYVALQGIHALVEPGLYPLRLKIKAPEIAAGDGTFQFSQQVRVESANYPFDPVLTVDPQTIDPETTEPEDKLWASLGEVSSLNKLWDGKFQSPVPLELKDCWTSLFGSRRSFNGSPYRYFHSGLDFCGTVGTELYSAAPGKVVYTGALIVRGNVVVIDHGWGVYTAYDHLSKILVEPGETVESGQLIGLGGDTGRTTGPHLHWEVWVGGVQVDPTAWLSETFP